MVHSKQAQNQPLKNGNDHFEIQPPNFGHQFFGRFRQWHSIAVTECQGSGRRRRPSPGMGCTCHLHCSPLQHATCRSRQDAEQSAQRNETHASRSLGIPTHTVLHQCVGKLLHISAKAHSEGCQLWRTYRVWPEPTRACHACTEGAWLGMCRWDGSGEWSGRGQPAADLRRRTWASAE